MYESTENQNLEYMKSFFIAGVQRSGTTLLSVLLDNHPAVDLDGFSKAFRLITCFKNHEKSHITSEVFILEKLNLRVKD